MFYFLYSTQNAIVPPNTPILMSSPANLGITGRSVFLFANLIVTCITAVSTRFTCIFFRTMTIRTEIPNQIIEFIDIRISIFCNFYLFIYLFIYLLIYLFIYLFIFWLLYKLSSYSEEDMLFFKIFFLKCFFTWMKT